MPLGDDGREYPDQTPIAIRVRNRVVTNFDDIRSIIRREVSAAAERQGAESFEEANDFDVDDEPVEKSRWEYSADQELEEREQYEAKQRELAAVREAIKRDAKKAAEDFRAEIKAKKSGQSRSLSSKQDRDSGDEGDGEP